MAETPKPNETKSGADIPQPEKGMVADWLFNQSDHLRRVIAAAVSWLNLTVYVRQKNADGSVTTQPGVKPVITGKNATLTLLVDSAASGTQQVVYVKCCLADGSEAYLPVLVSGTAYTANAGTTTPLSVTTGNVPDGSTVLE